MLPEIADIWIEQTHTQELAEIASLKLYQYMPYASVMAYKWMACTKKYYQIAAYNILGLLFNRGMTPNEFGINEFLDQAATALNNHDIGIRHAAYNCLIRFENLGAYYAILVHNVMKSKSIIF